MTSAEAIIPVVVSENGARILTKEEQKSLDVLTSRLQKNLKDTVRNLVDIGQDLKAAKELVGHGHFEAWMGEHFDLSDQTARRFMHVAEVFGDRVDELKHLSLSCVYLLAAPSTPTTVRDAVLQMVQEGREVTLKVIQGMREQSGGSPSTDEEVPIKESAFRSEIRKVNKKVVVWSEQIQKEWTGIGGAINKKSKAELETLHQQLSKFVETLGAMLAEAKEAPKAIRQRKPSSTKSQQVSKNKRKPGRPKKS